MRTYASQFRKTTLCAIAYLAHCFVVETVAQPIETALPNQLTTPVERAEFCARMRDAATPAARQAVAQKWHENLISRATEQGVDISSGMLNHQPMMSSDHSKHMGMDLNCGHTIAGEGNSNSPDAAVLHITQYGGIAYVTGGVGEDGAAAMRGVAPRYSMRARFTTNAGEFVSNVLVRVSNADGQLIFEANSDGPYLYAQVPPGRYRLGATPNGVEGSRSTDIPQRGGVDVFLTLARRATRLPWLMPSMASL